jgi:protein-S-isoprenylcysteine O-methyltransferase Ste14
MSIERYIMAGFELGIWNAWLMVIPFLAIMMCMVGRRGNVAKRMSNMTGYTVRERAVTISASLAPYPFIIATLWVPLTSSLPFLGLGIMFYIVGLYLLVASLSAIIKTLPDEPFTTGLYRFSRNPMYVSATVVFIGICLATANLILAAYLVIAFLLQHLMILAEERTCKEKYGMAFENYMKRVPRYLFIKAAPKTIQPTRYTCG